MSAEMHTEPLQRGGWIARSGTYESKSIFTRGTVHLRDRAREVRPRNHKAYTRMIRLTTIPQYPSSQQHCFLHEFRNVVDVK